MTLLLHLLGEGLRRSHDLATFGRAISAGSSTPPNNSLLLLTHLIHDLILLLGNRKGEMEDLDNPINNLWKRKLTFFSLRSTGSMFVALWLLPLFILPLVVSDLDYKIVVTGFVTVVCSILSTLFFLDKNKSSSK